LLASLLVEFFNLSRHKSLVFILLSPTCKTMKLLPVLLLVLTQALAFSPVLTTKRSKFAPSPVFAADDKAASPFDAYEPGQSTLVYKDEFIGEGEPAANGDVITVAFTGTLYPSGKQFAKSDGFPFTLGEGKTMPGFDVGFKGANVGTKRIIRVPPTLAFGARGKDRIPPNSDLEYFTEVKGIARSPIEGAMAKFGLKRALILGICISLLAISPLLGS